MEFIELNAIQKKDNVIQYGFEYSEGLKRYFSDKPFKIEYPVCIESVPDSLCAVPFVCNVLPIIWLTNSKLIIPELDKAFYECISKVKCGYQTMFPESVFAGQIKVDSIVKCVIPASGGSATFFSGGLDAVHTLIHHLDEKPALISVWGSDIRCDNVQGWEVVHKGIADYSEKYGLEDVVIRSSFRLFDDEAKLTEVFGEKLQDGWWHGVKHGIGLLGHAAPYAYLNGVSTVYIASSNCPTDGHVRCGSHPTIDNHVRFANSRVVHDGYENSRQDKARGVVEYVERTGNRLILHVCWESQTGGNCCYCEKCYRTMVALIAEGADPLDYGFGDARSSIQNLQRYILGHCRNDIALQKHWTHIQKSIQAHRVELRKRPDWKYIRWILKADFWHPETLKMPLNIREWLSQFKFYQLAHEIKVKLNGK